MEVLQISGTVAVLHQTTVQFSRHDISVERFQLLRRLNMHLFVHETRTRPPNQVSGPGNSALLSVLIKWVSEINISYSLKLWAVRMYALAVEFEKSANQR